MSQALTNSRNLTDTALESQIDGERTNRRIRKVGMKLTATPLFTFSQVCHEWNHNKIVQPYTLYSSRVDVLEAGGPKNSVLVDESIAALSEQIGYDLHRKVDARWVEHRPRVPCCYWDGESNDKHFLDGAEKGVARLSCVSCVALELNH